MNYAIQCTDILSGKKGDFGYDTDEYLRGDGPLQFKARTPVFPDLISLFLWAKGNGVDLEFRVVNWGTE